MRQRGDGILYLVMGPIGSGKQAVLAAARRRLGHDPRFVFPRRIITSSVNTAAEVHQAVTPAQFDDLRRSGSFALVWGSGGRNLALPSSIDRDIAAGCAVVAAATAVALAAAVAKYPRVGVGLVADGSDDADDYAAGILYACEEVVRLPGDSAEAAAAELVRRLKAAVPLPRPAVPSFTPRPVV